MKSTKDKSMEDEILRVAERLFLEKGFALTTTTEIAKEAGCNQALIHYYFRTKEILFSKIFEGKIAEFATIFTKPKEDDGDFEERMRKRIKSHFEILAKNPKLPLLILNELLVSPQRVQLLKDALGTFPQQVLNRLDEELQPEIEAGRVRPIKAIDIFVNIISLNVSFFALYPVAKTLIGLPAKEYVTFIKERESVIEETIINSIFIDR